MATFSAKPIQNYLSVQIVINNQNNKYYFPDLPQLRDAKINAICFYPALGNNVVDPNGVALISINDANSCYLTLDSGLEQIFQNIPLMKLANQWFEGGSITQQGNADGLFVIDELVIDFSKSFVSVSPTSTIGGTLPQSISFGIFYTK